MDGDEIDYDDLPEDPEQAFLVLERGFRNELTGSARAWGDEFPRSPYFDYMSKIRAAADALRLPFLNNWNLPAFDDLSEAVFRHFLADVDGYCTRTRIALGRRNKQYSVAFDAAAKKKIRHYLDQIREVVQNAELDDRKKEALLARIAALQTEVDRKRTRFDAFAAYAIEAAGVVGTIELASVV